MKKLFILSVMILLLFTGCKEKPVSQESPNTTNDYVVIDKANLIQNQAWADVEIKDIHIAYNSYMTTYKALLVNKKEGNSISNIKLTFYDEHNEKIITLYAPVDKTLKLNEEYSLITSTDIDLSVAQKLEYEVMYNA